MTPSKALSRRQFLNMSGLAVASAGLAGCTSSMNTDRFRAETAPYFRNPALEGRFADPRYGAELEGPVGDGMTPTGLPLQSAYYAEMYGPKFDGGFNIPAVPYQQIDARFYRQEVDNTFGERPGTIIVDTGERFLYLILSNGSAMRYGVGIGREGFAWSGRGVLQWKQKWPRWKPPNEMVARQPHLEKYSIANGGMAPGLDNPLGARAMYIFQNGEDTLYRLHGSPEWQSIGKAVSSGCVRLINQDVIDLYDRVRDKAPILVI
ncbi:L,D-transpeptidase family protein [Pararhizobium qamdonense]|uniref:L,D-transpeptidase family protein n=1 Tax=Pararhizobium qamdonense TaxID=3031126 RepID=UPI0023E11AA6|nr:L,D-transpeptidase family protein [Pararhizobium qamdonense]